MDAQPTSLLTRMFDDIQQLDDPRADNRRHFLTDILVIVLLAVMSGHDDFAGIIDYADDESEWLATFLRLPHGVPSISTFRRVFRVLKPTVLLNVMRRWSEELCGSLAGKQIAIDGKVLRRSFEHAWDKTGLHLVTAWCVEEKLVLAQKAVDEKSKEIVALPDLLKMLNLKGATVTVDAMGTQTDIAEQIVKAGGDYVMAVKDNHPTLADTIKRNMDDLILEKFRGVEHSYHESTDAGHGRIDSRQVWATSEIKWLQRRREWKNLTSVVVVQSTRRMVGTGEVQTSRRYYATSLPADATRLGALIRNHWSIENGQHFVLAQLPQLRDSNGLGGSAAGVSQPSFFTTSSIGLR